VFVALVIQHAKRMRRIILSSVASQAVPYFSRLSNKRCDFRGKKVTEYKMCVLIFFHSFVWNVRHFNTNSARYYYKCSQSSCKVPVISVVFLWNLNFLDGFSKSPQMSNLLKTRPVGAKLFHAEGERDGHTGRRKSILAFRNFANALKIVNFTSHTDKSTCGLT
jgi:hypothetical protein